MKLIKSFVPTTRLSAWVHIRMQIWDRFVRVVHLFLKYARLIWHVLFLLRFLVLIRLIRKQLFSYFSRLMNLITLQVLFLAATIVFAIFTIRYKDLFINFIILRWKQLTLFLINPGQLGQLIFIHAARWHHPFDRLWTLIFNVFIYVFLVSLEIKPLLKHF